MTNEERVDEFVKISGRLLRRVFVELQEALAEKPQSVADPHTTEEKKESIKDWANLVYNVGTIIEDRRDQNADMGPLWDYLWENMDGIYEQVGPIIDRVEETVFGRPPADAA